MPLKFVLSINEVKQNKMKLIFLKSTDNHDSEYFAIAESQIETLNVSDSYNNYGQRVGADVAGDCLVILTQAAADKANEIESNEYDTEDPDYKAPEPRFSVGDIVYAYDDRDIFNELVESFEDGDAIEIERTMFDGFIYHDGHNFQTIAVNTIDGSNEYEVEDDEEINNRLREAVDNMEWHHDEPGVKVYRYKDVEIIDSCWQGTWEKYSLTIDNDFEDENL